MLTNKKLYFFSLKELSSRKKDLADLEALGKECFQSVQKAIRKMEAWK